MASTHIFYAAALNIDATQKEIEFSQVGQSPIDSSANATFNIDPAIVSDMFRFDTTDTSADVADSSGAKFLVSYTKAAFNASDSNTFPYATNYPAGTKVDVGQMIPSNSNDSIGLDALYAAVKTMFGSVTAISLVNNQTTVVDQTHENIGEATSIRLTQLNGLASKGANETTDNPSAEMFDLIWQTEPQRFFQDGQNASSGWKSTLLVGGNIYKMPFIDGDKIVFQVTINPAATQILDPVNFLPGQENNPVVRTYNITLLCTTPS